MSILLTGGSGETAPRIASLLEGENIPFMLGSHEERDVGPNGYPTVKFDLSDESTWMKVLETQTSKPFT
jgi:festuclavine dehydrogenase